MARASEDKYIYSVLVECGCLHYFYGGPDTYCHTILCPKHREIIGYVPRKRQQFLAEGNTEAHG